MDWRERRDSTNINYLLQLAAEEGLSTADCLQGSAIDAAGLAGNAPLQLWQELAVIRNLVAAVGRPGLGLRLGQCYHLTSLGLLGYTMLASRTLADAIAVSHQFRPLSLSICPVTLVELPEGLEMRLDASVLPADARSMVIERGLAAWCGVFAELLQRPFVPARITLALPDPLAQALYQGYFSCPVSAAEHNSLLIARADLTSPLPLANAATQQTCAELCARLCAGLDEVQTPLARQVLQVLMRQSAQLLPAAVVAEQLGLSERSLHRRLAGERQSYRALDERVRRRLAERLLRDSRLRLDSIAQQLGYAEAASFSRAFKRWTGQAPAHWRQVQAVDALDPLLSVFTPSITASHRHA
ncbi:AraC family transcriptional regulator [Halopseudomonas salegens]|uniref:Transcriptional regulator, AraC family n=1 Tax=Halopseudomonas salegens TaxID=1434072 RepID=A0A1H2E7F2_9GAMM|nr:AraC family transcriptional regulator [Halopseudomonas salegens]SDT91003.1 transcriptional regulator, AraC family [Halopseudomonas salegens]